MANFLTGLGQALPQAVGLMTNIQDLQERARHSRAVEGMEQEKMGMMRQNYNVENRLRETQIRENELKTQAMEDEMKPYSVDNFMRTIQAPDRVKKMMEDKAAIFIKTSPSGERFVRKGDLKNIQQMLADPTFQLQINSATVQETRRELNALYAELNDKPNDKKITERVQQLEQMNQDALIAEDSLQRQLGIKEKAKSDTNMTLLDQLIGQFGREEGTRRFMEHEKSLKEKPSPAEKTNPKVVADPKSPTKWSYQDFNNPSAPLVPGAPPPHLPAEGLSPGQTVNAAHGLRNEIRQNPYVKDFSDVRNKYDVMLEALKSSKTATNKVAVDQAIITLFNKMTDPQSVVRESEYARTPQNLAIVNRVKGQANKILEGGAGLTDSDRNALVDMAKKFYSAYENNYTNVINDYEELAKKSKLDPDLVVGTYRLKGKKAKEVVRTGTYNGKKVVEYSDGSVEYAQ